MKWINILAIFLLTLALVPPVPAEDADDQMNSAGALYSQSVDLAEAGKYQEALDAADQALAMNVPSLTALIQSHRSGLLVMLDRNEEAIEAADAALAVEGDLKTAHSIAWYNKGNALSNLGRTAEAEEAYANAYALDSSLNPAATPQTIPIITPEPLMTQSPLPVSLVLAALGIAGCVLGMGRRG